MNKYFIPYLVACGGDISAHIIVVEAKDAIGAENKATFELMDNYDGSIFSNSIFDNSNQIDDEEDYILINMDSHIMIIS